MAQALSCQNLRTEPATRLGNLQILPEGDAEKFLLGRLPGYSLSLPQGSLLNTGNLRWPSSTGSEPPCCLTPLSLPRKCEQKKTPKDPLTKGQQRARLLGDLAPASLLPPVHGDPPRVPLRDSREHVSKGTWHLLHCRRSARQDGHLSPQGQFALCQTGWNGEGLGSIEFQPRLQCSTPLPRQPLVFCS